MTQLAIELFTAVLGCFGSGLSLVCIYGSVLGQAQRDARPPLSDRKEPSITPIGDFPGNPSVDFAAELPGSQKVADQDRQSHSEAGECLKRVRIILDVEVVVRHNEKRYDHLPDTVQRANTDSFDMNKIAQVPWKSDYLSETNPVLGATMRTTR